MDMPWDQWGFGTGIFPVPWGQMGLGDGTIQKAGPKPPVGKVQL